MTAADKILDSKFANITTYLFNLCNFIIYKTTTNDTIVIEDKIKQKLTHKFIPYG